MGIYDPSASSGSTSSGGSLPTSFADVMTFEAVTSGDPLSMLADGTVTVVVPPTDPQAAARPVNQAADATNVNTLTNNVTTYGTSAPLLLPNGNYLVPFLNTSQYPCFSIYTGAGALVRTVVIDNTANVPAVGNGNVVISAAILSNGNIAVAWATNNTYNPKFAIFNAAGDQVVAPTAIGANTNGNQWMLICALSGGGFAVAYNQGSTAGNAIKHPYCATYTNAGALQGGPTQLATLTEDSHSTPAAMAICPWDTGFGVSWVARTGGGTTWANNLMRLSSAAATLGAGNNQLGGFNVPIRTFLASISTGVLHLQGSASSANNSIARFPLNSSASAWQSTFDGSVYLDDAKFVVNGAQAAIFYGTFAHGARVKTYSADTISNNTSDGTVISSNATMKCNFIGAAAVPSYGSYVVTYGNETDGLKVKLYGVGNSAEISVGTSDYTGTTTQGGYGYVLPVTNVAGAVNFVVFNHSVNSWALKMRSYATTIKARSFIGVATATAAAGSSVKAQVSGSATMSKYFSPAVIMDVRANTIPGQKAYLVGTAAVMQGLQ